MIMNKIMMKKIIMGLIGLIFISIVFSSAFAFAEDFPVLDKQVKIRQEHISWISAIKETSMETVITYIDEISNETDTSELSSLLGDFQDQAETIKDLTTHVALNNALRQLRQTTTDFRLETFKQMKNNDGKFLVLLSEIATALEDDEELDSLKGAYWETRKDNALEIFDIRVSHAQIILDKLEENEYDITEAQEKLGEIKSKRNDLEDALDGQDNLKIVNVHLEIFDLSKELHKIVRDLQIEIPLKLIVKHWINVGSRVVERTDTIISELETLGIDVSELEEIHSKAEADLAKAESAFDAGNLGEAIDALEDLKTDLIELRTAYENLIFGDSLSDLSVDIEVRVNAMADALSVTVEDMGEDI